MARASLEELLIDYGDYLRTHRAVAWAKDSREARYVRRLGANPELKFEGVRELVESRPGPGWPIWRSAWCTKATSCSTG